MTVAGAGIGLRSPHFEAILSQDWGDLWFEILADNFMVAGGLNHEDAGMMGQFTVQ